ncbi:MAG: 2-oxoacid:acceptor oxidoreductase family protein, partial [Thermodesulfobacteriota bacterium]
MAEVAKAEVVNATRIALAVLNAPVTNRCMMGAFVRTSGWLGWEAVQESLKRIFPAPLQQPNIKAAQEACSFSEVTIVPQFGTMPYEDAFESTRLFAQEVLLGSPLLAELR